MNSPSLCQNHLTKTIAQINDCLFIYMKFKAMDHAFQHVPHFGRRKEWFVCACGVLHYGSFEAASLIHEINRLSSVLIVLRCVLEANLNFQSHNNARLMTIE